MVNLKKVGAALLLAGTFGAVGMAPASAYSTGECEWRVSNVAPFRTAHEQVCDVNFTWAEEKLFPGFVDGKKVMTKYYKFHTTEGSVTYGYEDTWWPDTSKNA